jgi:membrane protease subunit (stomatin/prohibitin family)
MYILDNENKINTKIVLEENGQYKVKTNEEVVGKICGVGTIAENRDVIGIIYIDDDFYFVHNERKILIDIQTFYMNNRLSEDGERIFEVYNEGMKLLNYLYQPYIDPGSLTYGLDDEEFDAILRFSNLWGKSSDLSKIKRYLDYVNKINMYMV